ncbi:MAG: YihY/virulence factor BrkB family protein [Candidatus Dormibacteraceae bacterium]
MQNAAGPPRKPGPAPPDADPQDLQPIFSPEQLAAVERPAWRRAALDRLRQSAIWPHLRDGLPGQVLVRFVADWGARDATLIAWSGLVSLLPLLLAVPVSTVQVLHLVGIDVNHVEQFELTRLIPNGPLRTALLQALRGAAQHQVLFGVGAAIGVLWRGSVLFRQLEICLSRIAGVRPRPYLRRLLLAVLLVLLIGVASIVATGAATVLIANPALREITHPAVATVAAFGFQIVLGLVSGFGIFMFIYGVIPNHAYRLRQVWPGAAFAAIGFELVTLIFPLYRVADNDFGGNGTDLTLLFVLVVYLYLLGVIVIVGADLNAVLWKRMPADGGPAAPGGAEQNWQTAGRGAGSAERSTANADTGEGSGGQEQGCAGHPGDDRRTRSRPR